MANSGLAMNKRAKRQTFGVNSISRLKRVLFQLRPDEGGRVFFIADGSALIAIYDYEGFNDGEYGKTENLSQPTTTANGHWMSSRQQ